MVMDSEGQVRDDSTSLDIELTWTSVAVWVRLVGELDVASARRVLDAVDAFELETEQVLVLDLTQVTFCDARGVATLVRIHRAAVSNGRRLTVHGASPQIRRLLSITGEADILRPI
jgi:anti-sigma B factor antagonist